MNPEIFFREWFGRKWRMVAFASVPAVPGQNHLCKCGGLAHMVSRPIAFDDEPAALIVSAGECDGCGTVHWATSDLVLLVKAVEADQRRPTAFPLSGGASRAGDLQRARQRRADAVESR